MSRKQKNEPTLLLALPTTTLLSKFGSGGHKPGSGSAAALLGLVACKLVQTVVSLSNGRSEYEGVKEQLTLANQDISSSVEPFLADAVERDSAAFDRVIRARQHRDSFEVGSKDRKAAAEAALEELRTATEIPVEIAQKCLELADYALTVFQLGFKSARGDSGVAVSAAISAVHGSLAIIFLNLTSFRGSSWAVEKRKQAEVIQERVSELQKQFYQALGGLHQEILKKEQQQ
jgi:formiminotetrahydrofolate cyclodeaminase